jgi:hypothetical protein
VSGGQKTVPRSNRTFQDRLRALEMPCETIVVKTPLTGWCGGMRMTSSSRSVVECYRRSWADRRNRFKAPPAQKLEAVSYLLAGGRSSQNLIHPSGAWVALLRFPGVPAVTPVQSHGPTGLKRLEPSLEGRVVCKRRAAGYPGGSLAMKRKRSGEIGRRLGLVAHGEAQFPSQVTSPRRWRRPCLAKRPLR